MYSKKKISCLGFPCPKFYLFKKGSRGDNGPQGQKGKQGPRGMPGTCDAKVFF